MASRAPRSLLRIIVEATPEVQQIYNEIRQNDERLRLQTYSASQQDVLRPPESPICEPGMPSTQDPSQNTDLPKRPRRRKKEPLRTDMRWNAAVKRRLKLACPYHPGRKCDCHDFRNLEEGYQSFLLRQATNADLSYHQLPAIFNPPSPVAAPPVPSRSTSPTSDSGYGTMSQDAKAPVYLLPSNRRKFFANAQINEEDTRTVYTEVADPSDMRTESFISIFAEDLLNKIGANELDNQTVERLSLTLPTLLKALALKVGREASSQILRDMMVFIHKHRDAITKSFRNKHHEAMESDVKSISATEFSSGTESSSETEPSSPREPASKEIIERWLTSLIGIDFEGIPDHPIKDEFAISDDNDLNIPGLEEYKKLIFKDPGYAWLLSRLRIEMAFSRAEPDTSCDIFEAIIQAIPRVDRVSRRKYSQSAKVLFIIDWPVLAFLHNQNYNMPNSEAIAKAITLTGSQTDAQALSCRQYMTQIWPSTGAQTLQLLQEMLGSEGQKKKLRLNTPSKLTLEAWIDGTSVVVSALGIPDFVGEIGEQLAWLGAALRPSPVDVGISLCTPYVDQVGYLSNKSSETQCIIKYRIKPCEARSDNVNGQCWHHLFANPVVAQGFPILRRGEENRGLELPLDMLVALARARYIDTFKSKVFIKGFSTMLVPTGQSEDSLIWHLLYNEDPGQRISYLDCGLEHVDVQVPCFEKCRHILGWCSSAVSVVGTTKAPSEVGKSRLPKSHSGCALEKAEISGGQFVTGTAAFTLGNKEKPVHISRFGYFTKLQWISSKYFVFWDEEEKRGWLVDGASALLHILRASLVHSKRKFQSAWLLDLGTLRDTDDQSQPVSALQVLISEENRDLGLYIDKTEVFDEETSDRQRNSKVSRRQTRHYRLEDRIEHIYNILEKLIDHQTDAARRSGLQMNIRPRRELEGWDFKDLATDGDPFFPRVATIQTIGKGWVDFTRTIHAVTLFGRGFGQLIQPKSVTVPRCPRWSSLPSGRYYLAALVSDLHEIMERDGDPTSNPRRLCDNIIWHMKITTFNPCPGARGIHKCHDPVQVLFPLKFLQDLRKKPQVKLEDRGAVIFGHNMNLRWYWGDNGDPVKGDPPPQIDLPPDALYDSGLGSSISSPSSRSASEPNGAIAPGEDTPSPSSSLTLPSVSPGKVPKESRRPLHDMVSSISKRVRMS